jgi:ATP-dependent exoDNAse (exonuclease V) beta subunit
MTGSRTPGTRELVVASAGSGKTFRISSRIIALLARGEPPGSIFASTFTRKAAGEILERVLVRLARAALDAGEARELARHALGPDPLPGIPSTDPAFWRGVLRRTVAGLHRLDVSTLDAFFVRAVGSFAHDLGLPPGWGISDEPTTDRLRTEALEEVLDEVDEGVLVELVRSLHAGDVRRSVHEGLAREVDEILAVHRSLDPEAPGWGAMREAVGERPGDLEERCREVASRLETVDVPLTKSGSPNGHFVNAREAAANKIRERDWEGYVTNGLYNTILMTEPGEVPTYYRKPLPEPMIRTLEEGAELARAGLGPDLAARAEAMGRLAESYEEAWIRRTRETGRLRFQDVTRLLTGPRPLGGRPDLLYRLDGSTRHLLLDEFQDTSLLQWRALRPLADALVGGADTPADGAAVVVADPKQSIYGWRGAAPVVLEALEATYDLPRETLARSWRSSPVVLDAVNRVFDGVHEAPLFQVDEGDADVARSWARAFEPHAPAPPNTSLPGRVELVAGPPRKGKGNEQPELCRWAADRVRSIHQRAPGRSIGVLCRTNDTVARMIFELGRLHVPASEEGGTQLTDSAAVASVLALLRLADHPGDGVSRYHVASTPVGGAVGFTDWTDGAGAAALSHRVRRRLVDEGYGATLADLAGRLEEACDDREFRRLRRLVELGYRYDAELAGAGLRVDDFVQRARAERAESPGQDPVRVMTIHRSKGLEFDVVVLPELHANMFGKGAKSRPLAYRRKCTGPITHAFPPTKRVVAQLFREIEELAGARRQARAAKVRDALGTLYVATTRARYALHMIIPADGENGPGTTRSHARLLRERLPHSAPEDGVPEGEVLFADGDPDWSGTAPPPPTHGAETRPPTLDRIALRTTGPRRRALERRSPSSEEGADGTGSVDLALRLGLRGSPEGRERGTLVHAWLEQVEWVEDGLPPTPELHRIARAVVPGMPADAVERQRAWLARALEAPEVLEALSRSAAPPGARVERELPFLRREGDALVEGFIDRLVLVPPTGTAGDSASPEAGSREVERAVVLDYKTDRIDPDDRGALEARVDHYAPQIRAYRRAVAELYEVAPEAVEGRLVFLDAGVVQEVE